jgi:hypothetical protein
METYPKRDRCCGLDFQDLLEDPRMRRQESSVKGHLPVLMDDMISGAVGPHSSRNELCRAQRGMRSGPQTDGKSEGTVVRRTVGQFRDTMSTAEETRYERWRVSEMGHH